MLKMKLYILEGCHAAGKTTILNKLPFGINVINENYFELDRFECNSICHQYDWLLNWVHRVLEYKKYGIKLVVSDRGPITSLIYKGPQFSNLINEIFKKLNENDIEIINILVSCPEIDEHIKRITNRNNQLVEVEVENLEIIKNKYKEICKDYLIIENIEDLLKILKI